MGTTSSLAIRAGQLSEKGIKSENQDCCGIKVPEEPLLTTKGITLMVADGVSSSAAGRQASEACVKGFMLDYYSTPESWTVKTSGQRILGALNRWLYGESARINYTGQGMLTTLSVLVLKSTTAHIFHVGDSRIYRLRGNELERLTRDHTTWASESKAFLARAMGADLNIDIDYRNLPLEVGDIFILATDGVYEYLHAKDMIALVQKYRDNPDRAARQIVKQALANGSHDNVTCQVCEIESLPNQNEEEFYRQLTELPFPPPLQAGQIIDGYKVIREIHASKRTQVYLVLDTASGQKWAMKTPSVNFEDDPQYIDGFLHEEWAGRRINSPHVLKVIEPPRPRRFLYYLTEYIEGQSLRQWMNDHPNPPLAEAREIVGQLIKGVRALLRQEMVHQDLKPENIMLDEHGTLKIIDFGSTKIAGMQEIAAPIERGALLGTLDYSAPEYFLGYPGTHLSDIYSIGVITYEMLCGKLPYGGPLSARNLKRVRYRPINHINPEIPAWVDAALEKAVRLNPERRYKVLSEFLQDLTHPNPELVKKQEASLLERNPTAFWRSLAIVLFITNLVLLFFLLG